MTLAKTLHQGARGASHYPRKKRNSAKHQANKNPDARRWKDILLPEINKQEEQEAQDILVSRMYYRRLQDNVKWSAGTTTTRSDTTLPGLMEALTFPKGTIRAIRRFQDPLSGLNSGSRK